MKRSLYVLLSMLFSFAASAQGGLYIPPGSSLYTNGTATLTFSNTTLTNNGTFTDNSGTVVFSGNATNANSTLNGTGTTQLHNLTVAKTANSIQLNQPIAVSGNLMLTAGGVELNNGNINLGTTGSLIGETNTNRIYGSGGEVWATAVLNAPSQVNAANLGAEISSAQNLGTTLIKRGQVQYMLPAGSVLRYYDISPANNNALNANLRFHYFDSELNGNPESGLSFWESANNGTSWTSSMGTVTRDTVINWVQLSGLGSFSRYTLGVSAALPNTTISNTHGLTINCIQTSTVLSVPVAAGYAWTKDGNAFATTDSVTVTQAGVYSVTVTGSNGATASSSVTIVADQTPPVSAITPQAGTITCANPSVVLSVSSPGTYLWSNGSTTSSTSVSVSNPYSVTVTGANGCTATASSYVFNNTTPPALNIAASGPTSFCAPGSVSLSVTNTAGATYQWTGGTTTTSIVVSTGGTYGITATGANGCTASAAPVTVVVNTAPVIVCPAPFNANAPAGTCGVVLPLYANATGQPTPTISFLPASNSFFNAGSTTVTATATNVCGTSSCTYPVVVTPNDPTAPGANPAVTNAVLSWTSGNSGSGYQVRYHTGSSSFNPSTAGIAVNGSGSSVSLSGLTAATTYHWYIREVCGSTFTNWIDGGVFTTNSGAAPANIDPCAGVTLPLVTGQQMGFSTFGQFAGITCNLLTQSNANAVQLAGQPAQPSCSDGLTGNHKTVWYTFTTPSCSVSGLMPFAMKLSTDNAGTALTADTYMELFSSSTGNCGGVFTSVACNNNYVAAGCSPTGNTNASTLTINGTLLPSTTYYLRVGNYSVTAPGGNIALSMTIEPSAPVVTANAAAPYDKFDVAVANTGATNYVYYYRQVGASGYNNTITSSPAFTSGQLVPGNDYEVQVQHRCVTGNQVFRTPVVTYHVPALVGCGAPTPLTCGATTSTSVSFSWPSQANVYTGGGVYSGYVLYYRVTGAAGYNYFTNLVPTSCSGGICTATITGLLPNTSYDVWIGARCTAVTVFKSNTITCNTTLTAAPRQPITDDVYTFSVGASEYHDVRLTDNWSDFGLALPTTGSAYIDVSTGKARVLNQEGGYELSPEAFVPAKATGLGFDLVPNPTTSATNVIIYTAETTNAICTVFDLQGNVVANEVLNDVVNGATVRIATDRLAAGVYMVAVKTSTNMVTKKLVVIK